MKTIEHIPVPKEWESDNDWDSHRPLLWLAVNNTEGNILEYGSGDGSTKLLKEVPGRKISSLETNKEWADKTGSTYVEKYDEPSNEIGLHLYDNLVFIDAAPASIRHYLIMVHAKKAKVIVIHDTEEGAEYVYRLKEILNTFKYRVDYRPEGKPHTTAVSNFINVEEWI